MQATTPKFTTANWATPGVGCTFNCRQGMVAWSAASLAPGESTMLQYLVTVDNTNTNPPPPNGTLLASSISALAFGNVTVKHTVMVADGKALDLNLREEPYRVAADGMLNYTISYGNTGTNPTAARLRTPLPRGTSFVSATGASQQDGGNIEWDLGNIAAGASEHRGLTVQVAANAVHGTLIRAAAELRDPISGQSLVRRSTNAARSARDRTVRSSTGALGGHTACLRRLRLYRPGLQLLSQPALSELPKLRTASLARAPTRANSCPA